MRKQATQPLFVWIGILVLIVLLATLAGGSIALRGESGPSPTPLNLTGRLRPPSAERFLTIYSFVMAHCS